jgi:hypothetical protein
MIRALTFNLMAPNESDAAALALQSDRVLSAFDRYLRRSIEAAKRRQTRWQVAWEPVAAREVQLRAKDTVLRVLCPRPAWVVDDWPSDGPVDASVPLMIVSRAMMATVHRATRIEGGVRIETDAPLSETDQVFWHGRPCALRRIPTAEPPAALEAPAGTPRTIRGWLSGGDDAWRVVIEGAFRGREVVTREHGALDCEVEDPLGGQGCVSDVDGDRWEIRDGYLAPDARPAKGELLADNFVRVECVASRTSGDRWVQLVSPEDDEGPVDVRAVFCEGDIAEVWTAPRRSDAEVLKVERVDRERYRLLLSRRPPEGCRLFLPEDVRNLQLQRRAIRQLMNAPLPHHRGLIRLCEDPKKVTWPPARPRPVSRWYSLTALDRSGTEEQRRFVESALGTEDFAFLEGPPGSGKTTAICELIQQLVTEGKRVLLCGSTHYAIDNVLERVTRGPVPIDAVRIGRSERVDEIVRSQVLGERAGALVTQWRAAGTFPGERDEQLVERAERLITMAADLTCATTMGIASHPLFRHEQDGLGDRPLSQGPSWDVLIIDEASKTRIQEFLVPAMMARRWVIVGDVRQLPPFADREEIEANLDALAEGPGAPLSVERGRARLVLFRLAQQALRRPDARWLVVEQADVIRACISALEDDSTRLAASSWRSVVRIVRDRSPSSSACTNVSVDDVREGRPEALALLIADLVLVEDELLSEVADRLPATLVTHRDLPRRRLLDNASPWLFRQHRWIERNPTEAARGALRDEVESVQKDLETRRFESEVGWRIARLHELKHRGDIPEATRLRDERHALLPVDAKVRDVVEEIEDLGLPSILEVLQRGIGAKRATRESAMTAGMGLQVFRPRAASLSYQHRMHPEISAFPRSHFYEDRSLKDANTLASRDAALRWNFAPYARRSVWLDVVGSDEQGRNLAEVAAIRGEVEAFLRWVVTCGAPERSGEPRWSVACLSFYGAQQRALAEMLQTVTGIRDRHTRFEHPSLPVDFVCGTVDRFQGREADLVLLSLRNTGRTGFLNSPNRLNVALTRARQQLVVVGHRRYFSRCNVSELRELATRTPSIEWRSR